MTENAKILKTMKKRDKIYIFDIQQAIRLQIKVDIKVGLKYYDLPHSNDDPNSLYRLYIFENQTL